MERNDRQQCGTCPAFSVLAGEGGAGTCRANPPAPLQDDKYFRGSSRDLWFGSYPVVGAFPLVHENDFCLAHPGNRGLL